MNIKTIAFILLMERLVAVLFGLLALMIQIPLLRKPILQEVMWTVRVFGKLYHIPVLKVMRWALFVLMIIILVGNFIPILIDTLTLFLDVGRANPSPIGVAYAVSNATTAVVASFMIWLSYWLVVKASKLSGD